VRRARAVRRFVGSSLLLVVGGGKREREVF
jgi:hypothetical protein